MTIVTDRNVGAPVKATQQALAEVYGVTGVRVADLDARLARAAATSADPTDGRQAAMVGILGAALVTVAAEHAGCRVIGCATCWYVRDALAALAAQDMRDGDRG